MNNICELVIYYIRFQIHRKKKKRKKERKNKKKKRKNKTEKKKRKKQKIRKNKKKKKKKRKKEKAKAYRINVRSWDNTATTEVVSIFQCDHSRLCVVEICATNILSTINFKI